MEQRFGRAVRRDLGHLRVRCFRVGDSTVALVQLAEPQQGAARMLDVCVGHRL